MFSTKVQMTIFSFWNIKKIKKKQQEAEFIQPHFIRKTINRLIVKATNWHSTDSILLRRRPVVLDHQTLGSELVDILLFLVNW